MLCEGIVENELPPTSGVPTEPSTPTSPGEPIAASGSFRRPADYYSAPLPPEDQKRGCPKWVPIGCGLGGCLILVLLFVAGTMAVRDGSGRFSRWFVTRLQAETMTLLAPDVPAPERAALQHEFDLLLRNLSQKKTSFMQMQSLLQTMNSAIGDRRVTREEAEQIRKDLEKVNQSAGETRPATKPESVDL
jgi:hypothetical protein